MQTLSHSEAALSGNLATTAACLGRQARMGQRSVDLARRDEDYGNASSLVRFGLTTAEQAHDLFHVMAQALANNNPKPHNAKVLAAIEQLEAFADQFQEEVLL